MPDGLLTTKSKVTVVFGVAISTEFGDIVNETNVGTVGASACAG